MMEIQSVDGTQQIVKNSDASLYVERKGGVAANAINEIL